MISMNDFSNWFSHLLSRQINTDNLYRLWDYYLSNGISDHVYICLAIIGNFSEMIEDMENGSEIRGFINRISVFDVDWVIGNALEIKVQLARNGIVVFE